MSYLCSTYDLYMIYLFYLWLTSANHVHFYTLWFTYGLLMIYLYFCLGFTYVLLMTYLWSTYSTYDLLMQIIFSIFHL